MSRFSVNHVGFAVPSIRQFLDAQAPLFAGFSRSEMIVNETQKVREQFITDGNCSIELLEPLSADSPISAFLKSHKSGGLLHLALNVPDMAAALARVEAARGVVLTPPVPDVAFAGRRIAFVHLGGHVTELIEEPRS